MPARATINCLALRAFVRAQTTNSCVMQRSRDCLGDPPQRYRHPEPHHCATDQHNSKSVSRKQSVPQNREYDQPDAANRCAATIKPRCLDAALARRESCLFLLLIFVFFDQRRRRSRAESPEMPETTRRPPVPTISPHACPAIAIPPPSRNRAANSCHFVLASSENSVDSHRTGHPDGPKPERRREPQGQSNTRRAAPVPSNRAKRNKGYSRRS